MGFSQWPRPTRAGVPKPSPSPASLSLGALLVAARHLQVLTPSWPGQHQSSAFISLQLISLGSRHPSRGHVSPFLLCGCPMSSHMCLSSPGARMLWLPYANTIRYLYPSFCLKHCSDFPQLQDRPSSSRDFRGLHCHHGPWGPLRTAPLRTSTGPQTGHSPASMRPLDCHPLCLERPPFLGACRSHLTY